jgi:hypothetical protein
MTSNIEIESRALLSVDQRGEMLRYMETLGKIEEVERTMIDFSGRDRGRTVVVRVNNGVQELVAKSGKLTDSIRQETRLQLPIETPLEQTLSYLAIMGYGDAIVSVRKMFTVQTADLEYSIRDILSSSTGTRVSTLFEIEALHVTEVDKQAALAKVKKAFGVHGIEPLSKDEWRRWVEETQEHVDRSFAYSPEAANALAQSLRKNAFPSATIEV